MEGVIILKTFETVIDHQPEFTFWSWMSLIGFVIFFGIGIYRAAECLGGEGFFSVLAAVCFAAMISTCMLANPVMETQYKAYIEPSVNFAEFQEHYEIVSQNGVVYTLREVNQNGEEIHN